MEALPPPRREIVKLPPLKQIFVAHVSEEGNVISICQAGEIIRSVLHDQNNTGFLQEAARVLYNASNLDTNRSGKIMALKTFGQGVKVTHGGESAASG